MIKYFGLILGLFLCFVTFKSQKFFIAKLFGLKYLYLDKPLLGYSESQRYNLVLTLVIEDFNAQKFKTHIIEKGIKKIPKLMSNIVYIFFDFYWKVQEDAKKLEKMIENTFIHSEIHSQDDLIYYCQKEVQIHVENLREDKFPYEIHLIKFKNCKNGAILIKCDHVLSDGLGLVGFICSIADNYSEDVFHPMLRTKKFSIFHEIIGFILFPFYLIRVSLRIIFFNKVEKTPFKKIYDANERKQTGRTVLAISEARQLSSYEKVRKFHKISFNDLTVSVILSSFKKHFNNLSSMNFVLPFGKTGIPKSVEDVEIQNKSGGIFIELPLIESIEKDSQKIHKLLSKELKDIFNVSCSNFLFRIMIEFLPSDLINYISDISLDKVDLIHSNLPGPVTNLYYDGSKVLDFLPLISTGRAKAVLPVFSFHKKFRVVVAYDESVGLDPKDLLKTIENEFEEIEKKYHAS